MLIEFYKYQGTGNDFILIDNRQLIFPKNNTKLVAQLCDRKFGIGADGLILLEGHDTANFSMVYYNSDGNISSMCGNGGRCITHFAAELGIITSEATFEAIDGMHTAKLRSDEVALKMNDVLAISEFESHCFLNTGSPHHVQLVEHLDTLDVVEEGRNIRTTVYGKEGANVNFVEALAPNTFAVRTYERGVENETLSCGTGVTAVALVMHSQGSVTGNKVTLHQPGGTLEVSFSKKGDTYTDIYLIGPATQVFKGTITL